MAEEKGAFRHIVLLKVGKKEDVGEVMKTLSNMGRAVASHVSILSFDVTPDMGISNGNADVALIIDFPDEENFHAYQNHHLHLAAVNHNKQFCTGRTAIQFPLPKSHL